MGVKAKPFTINIQVKLTAEDINNIMSSALTGCTYWADEANVIPREGKETPDMYPSESLTRGYFLNIHDAEEDKWHKLTLRKFMDALAKTPRFDYDDYDQVEAEQVLQTALFGKPIYG